MQVGPRELAAVAFIADKYAATGNPVGGLMPIFGSLLSQMGMTVFEPNEFARQVREAYNLEMNPLVARALIPEMEAEGWLVGHGKSREIYTVQKQEVSSDVVDTDGVDEMLDGFAQYVKGRYSTASISKTGKALKSAFLAGMMTKEMLAGFVDARKDAQSRIISLDEGLSEQNDDRLSEEERLLRFAIYEYADLLRTRFPEKFQTLEKIARGALIAETVMSMQRPASAELLRQISVIIDAPLLLDRLGLSTPEFHQYARDLFDLMDRGEVQKYAFEHSVVEMERVLSATLGAVHGNAGYGPLATRIQFSPGDMLKVRAATGTLKQQVQELGVKIIDSAARYDQKNPFHEQHWGALMTHICGDMQSLDAKDADTASAIDTLQKRKGNNPPSMVDAKWVFVTKNQRLARNANRYFVNKRLLDKESAPPLLTDLRLAASLWFCADMSHAQIGGMLNSRVIATCSAVREPGIGLIAKVLDLLKEKDEEKRKTLSAIVPEKCVRYFLSSKAMRETEGVTRENVLEFYEGARQALRDEIRAEVVDETHERETRQRQVQDEQREEIEILRQQIESGRKDLLQQEQKAAAAEKTAEDKSRESEELKAQVRKEAEKRLGVLRDAASKILEQHHAEIARNIGMIGGLCGAGFSSLLFPEIGGIYPPVVWLSVGLALGVSAWQAAAKMKSVRRFLFDRFVERKVRAQISDLAEAMGISRNTLKIDSYGGEFQVATKDSPEQ